MFRPARDKRINTLLLASGSFVLGLQVVFDLWVWHGFSALGNREINISSVFLAAVACICVAWLGVRLTFTRLERMQDSKLERFYELLRHDALTGALNRTFFLDQIRADGTSGVLLAIDIDHFKAVNDQYGHYTGDAALAHLAAVMSAAIGDHGFLGRLGGEEFAVFLPTYTADHGTARSETLRQAIEQTEFKFDGITINLTVSIGVAFHDKNLRIEETLRIADDRLYAAKKLGRNCVATHANPVIAMHGKVEQAQARYASR